MADSRYSRANFACLVKNGKSLFPTSGIGEYTIPIFYQTAHSPSGVPGPRVWASHSVGSVRH